MKLRMLRLLSQYVAVYHLAVFLGGVVLAVSGAVGIFMVQPGPAQPIDAVLAPGIGTGSFVAVLSLGMALVLLALVKSTLRMRGDLAAFLRESNFADKEGSA